MQPIKSIKYEKREDMFSSFIRDKLVFYPHIHSQIELIYVCAGKISVKVGNCRRVLKKNELAVIFPNTVHSYQSDSKCCVFLLIFNVEIVAEYAKLLTTMRPKNPFIGMDCLHEDALRALHNLGLKQKCCLNKSLLTGYLLILLGRIWEGLELEKATHGKDASLLQRVLSFIDMHFYENLDLDEVARSLQISKYHLSRCFSQKIGVNFNVFVNALHAQYAENLLMTSSLSITDICYEAGFESLSTYYRAFLKTYGESPGKYRMRMQSYTMEACP